MTYALVIFETPNAQNQQLWQTWQTLLDNLENAANQNNHIEKIHENVWLFDLQNVLPLFVQTLSDSNAEGITNYTSFLDKKPSFITSQ